METEAPHIPDLYDPWVYALGMILLSGIIVGFALWFKSLGKNKPLKNPITDNDE